MLRTLKVWYKWLADMETPNQTKTLDIFIVLWIMKLETPITLNMSSYSMAAWNSNDDEDDDQDDDKDGGRKCRLVGCEAFHIHKHDQGKIRTIKHSITQHTGSTRLIFDGCMDQKIL